MVLAIFVMCTGEYMGLTGATLNGAEMVACGLATHYSLSAVCSLSPFPFIAILTVFFFMITLVLCYQNIPLIEEQLKALLPDDPMPSVIEAVLAKFCDVAYPDERSVLHR